MDGGGGEEFMELEGRHGSGPKDCPAVGETISRGVVQSSLQQRRPLGVPSDLVGSFDKRKKELMSCIGFGGLLKFPRVKCINRRFAAWLMSCVDVRRQCIVMRNGSSIPFSKDDVAIVFGVPAGGCRVDGAGQLTKEIRVKISECCWPASEKEQRSLRALGEVLRTKYVSGMSAAEEESFQVAFVVYVLSILLAPSAKYDYVCLDYWPALVDPRRIRKYDWAQYVVDRLLAGACKWKAESGSSGRVHSLSGCHMFLQVLYLDSIDLGQLSMDHNIIPRIGCFSAEVITAMTVADSIKSSGEDGMVEFGASKLRPTEGICYSWAQNKVLDVPTPEGGTHLSLWEVAVRAVRVLRLPLEAAGPLFLSILEIHREFHHIMGNIGVLAMNVLLRVMHPYVNCFRYSFELETTETGEDSSDDANFDLGSGSARCGDKRKMSMALELCSRCGSVDHQEGECNIDQRGVRCESRTQESIERIVSSVMAKFYLAVACMKAHRRIDLNLSGQGNCMPRSFVPVDSCCCVGNCKTPWELGGLWDCNECYDDKGSMDIRNVLERFGGSGPLVVHHYPKYIEVMPNAAIDQLTGLSEMEMDLFDALMRRFMKRDDLIHVMEGRHRWRHFFESDFLASAIAGCFDLDNPNILNQLVGSHMCYDLFRCATLFFPVILQHRWVCFCWVLRENNIVIFDPLRWMIPGFSTRGLYSDVVGLLKSTMRACAERIFDKWEFDWEAATVEVFRWSLAGSGCWNRTAVVCCYFCQCFDGHRLLPEVGMRQLGVVPSKLLGELLLLDGNCAAYEVRI